MDTTTLLIGSAVIIGTPVIWISVAKSLRYRKAVRRRLYTITEGRQPLFPRVAAAAAREREHYIPGGQALMPEQRKSLCCNAATFRPRWTADGWVAPCQMCGAWQYLGDDYSVKPEDAITDFHGDMAKTWRSIGEETPWGKPRYRSVEPDHGLIESDTPIHPLQAEVTSGDSIRCEDCDTIYPREDRGCPNCGLRTSISEEAQAADNDDGDELPAAMLHTPNIGGEGHPEYEGPHYDSIHGLQDRFVRYDMLREPPAGAAVYTLGQAAAFGPLPQEGEDNAEQPDRPGAD